ncbi:HET-domain-containing protein [Coniochaeta sp. PMI_546]|nr:HET-domain-containing protein [Coniochaeta sp. PMI_546]
MKLNSYTYQPLSAPDALRLVVLDPAEDSNDPLFGTLLHTTLADCDYDLVEPYTSLSYVWGDPTQTGTIYISGQVVTITATLASALRHLRDATRPRRVWADALCIDQSNIPERNKQVTLMGVIYSVAAHTVVYLGPATRESDLVLQSAPRSLPGTYLSLDPVRRAAIVQAAIVDILARPWFRRVWIFQELILSRDPWVQCGQRRTRWADFCGLLLYSGLGIPRELDEKLRMLDSMNRSRQGSNAGKMLSLLQARRGLGATDARDFVYAHMGIASDRLKVGDAVPVDYDMPLGLVFARMSLYIAKSESMDTLVSLLDQQAEGAGTHCMPTWAVDWSVAPSRYAPMYVDNLLNRERLFMAPAMCLEEDGVLGLVGHSVGLIEHLSASLPMSATLDLAGMARYQETVSKISALYNSTGGVYYTGDSMGRYARVGLRNHEQEHKKLCETLFSEWLLFLQAVEPGTTDVAEHHATFLRYFKAWTQEQVVKSRIFVTRDSTDLLRIMWEYLHPGISISSLDGRRLATSQVGNIGVVPAQAQEGDHVVDVIGSRVSLVLRPLNVDHREAERIADGLRTELRSMRVRSATGDAEVSQETRFMSGIPLTTDASPVKHYLLVGSCCFDGQVPWTVTQLPGDKDEMTIYALH